MERFRFQPVAASCVVLLACFLGGCGNGLLGEDDVRPGACAAGPIQPLRLQTPPSRESTNLVRVYLLRGYRNVYSLGFDRLAEQMKAVNLNPTMIDWPFWEEAARVMLNEYPTFPNGCKLMLVGHSYGADDAIRIANILKTNGIEVRLLYLLDATVPDPIPDNVIQCIHYYTPWLPGLLAPGFFSGNPVELEPGNEKTRLTNLQFTREALGEGIGCADHFSIEANQLMQNMIIEEAIRLTSEP